MNSPETQGSYGDPGVHTRERAHPVTAAPRASVCPSVLWGDLDFGCSKSVRRCHSAFPAFSAPAVLACLRAGARTVRTPPMGSTEEHGFGVVSWHPLLPSGSPPPTPRIVIGGFHLPKDASKVSAAPSNLQPNTRDTKAGASPRGAATTAFPTCPPGAPRPARLRARQSETSPRKRRPSRVRSPAEGARSGSFRDCPPPIGGASGWERRPRPPAESGGRSRTCGGESLSGAAAGSSNRGARGRAPASQARGAGRCARPAA